MAGGWDLRYGARLCSDMQAPGLVDVQADYVASRDIEHLAVAVISRWDG
jgi:hypothetical protein